MRARNGFTMTKNLTPAAFLAIVNKSQRSDADVNAASQFLRRNAYHAALWVWTRTATDGASGAVVADEADVTASRISQIRGGVRLMLDAGIPLPTTVGEAATCEHTYAAISRAYKSGKTARAALKDAAKRADALSDVTAKHETMAAVGPIDDNKRAPRPNDGTTDTDTDTHDGQNNGTPATAHTVTERPSTVTERLEALALDILAGAAIADLDAAQRAADRISDAIAERAATPVAA